MNQLYLSGIYIYPVKSLGGISLDEAEMEERGLKYDRRWMLIDKEGTFVSQRKYHTLALLTVSMTNDVLTVTHKRDQEKQISFTIGEQNGQQIAVTIWDDHCKAIEVSTKVSRWFSDFLEMEVRLVEMPETEKRAVDPKYAQTGEIVSFADGYPCLLIGQASLDNLNEKLEQAVPMDRFRPNFVFTGGNPHLEDSINTFTLGNVLFTAVKPCARCVLITIDQQTAIKSTEPLKTLAGYRTVNKKVMFGQNLIHQGSGIIYKGDELQVRTWKPLT